MVDGVLRISARQQEQSERKGKDSYRSEFRHGSFVRHLMLPARVGLGDIKASDRDGILEVQREGSFDRRRLRRRRGMQRHSRQVHRPTSSARRHNESICFTVRSSGEVSCWTRRRRRTRSMR